MKERMLKYFPGAIIWDIFGQTEMTPAATFRFDTARGELKDRSVGRPIQETRIVNEKGRT
jgi:AMP-binding enzyme.